MFSTPQNFIQPALATLAVILLVSCGGEPSKKEKASKTKSFDETYSVLPIIDEGNIPRFKLEKGEAPPVTAKQFIAVVDRAVSLGAYDDAKEYARKGLVSHPKSGKLHYLLAKTLMSTVGKNEKEAVKHLEEATKLGYETSKLYELLATLYGDQKKYDKAISVLTRAIKMNPRDRTLYKFRAVMYIDTNQMKKAEKDYTTLIEITGKEKVSASYISRAQFYEAQNKLGKALEDYTSAYKTGVDKLISLKKRVTIYIKLDRIDEAIEDLNEIIKLNPPDDDAFTRRGDLYTKRKDYEKALADYTKAIDMSPDYAYKAYEGRSIVYENLNKPELAKKDRQKAKSLYSRPAEKTLFKMKDKKR